MRFIDKWVGIPFTFFFTIILFLFEKLLFIKEKIPNTKRTLFIELSEMGSAVLVDPAMRKLRDERQSELFFVIFQENYKSLQILNTIPEDHIFKMRANNLMNLAKDVVRYIFWCRSKKITTVIDLELFSRFTALLSGLSGARSRIGFTTFHDEGMYRGSIINKTVRYNPHVHITVNFISLVNCALNLFHNPYATEPIKQTEIKLAQANLNDFDIPGVKKKIGDLYPGWESKRIVIINPNASDLLPQRRWLPEYFVNIGKDLISSFKDILIIATGAPSERDYVQKVVDQIGNDRCVNSAGIFDFLELIPLYSLSTLMLTNDSGPAHFSSVTPLKVFVIMGPETPSLYGPLGNAEALFLGLPCSPCVSAANHRKTTCISRPCITGIKPEWVSVKLKNHLVNSY